ncbi:hypothetical protein NGA_2053810, partial [Nannochloropsis gaditana CCMP526]|uniref:uncharacterized protein n=1 Tax=Nannochloropsis gaditana (strain CCMP526) TaxID=1093141 RepID=UPI00029F5AF1
ATASASAGAVASTTATSTPFSAPAPLPASTPALMASTPLPLSRPTLPSIPPSTPASAPLPRLLFPLWASTPTSIPAFFPPSLPVVARFLLLGLFFHLPPVAPSPRDGGRCPEWTVDGHLKGPHPPPRLRVAHQKAEDAPPVKESLRRVPFPQEAEAWVFGFLSPSVVPPGARRPWQHTGRSARSKTPRLYPPEKAPGGRHPLAPVPSPPLPLPSSDLAPLRAIGIGSGRTSHHASLYPHPPRHPG